MNTNKEFKAKDRDDNEQDFIFRFPNADDLDQADMFYAAKIAKLVRQKKELKLLTRAEVDDFLRENDIWSDKDQERVDSINNKVQEGLALLKKGGIKLSEGRRIAIEVTDARQDLVSVMKKRQIFDNATIEAVADDEKVDYLIYACTVHADSGKNYWNSFEDMKEDKANDVYRAASGASVEILYGIDADFEKNLPENKWLMKYNFIDESLTFTDRKTGEFVDKEGRPVEEATQEFLERFESLVGDIEEETPFIDDYGVEETPKKKKKTTRKKKAPAKKAEEPVEAETK